MAEMASSTLVPVLWNPRQGSQASQGRTWVTGEKALELVSSDGTLGTLVKLFEPQFSYV